MTLMTTFTTVIGVLLSTVSGLICYLGAGATSSILSKVPTGGVILAHPESTLAAGVLFIVLGILCQPNRAY